MKKGKTKLDKYLLLSWKKFGLVILAWIAAAVLHNLVYAVIKYSSPAWTGDEAFFFIIAIFVIPIYLLVSVIYSLARRLRKV